MRPRVPHGLGALAIAAMGVVLGVACDSQAANAGCCLVAGWMMHKALLG